MITIIKHEVETIKDPFGILPGQRYEFLLDIEVPEDDELYTENGLYVRVIYQVVDEQISMVKHEIYERATNQLVDFELEDDELEIVEAYCRERI